MTHISPSGFVSMHLRISVALMLCASVTFFIDFFLLPWVLSLIVVFYVPGIVSAISMAGRSILCYVLPPPPSSSSKKISGFEMATCPGQLILEIVKTNNCFLVKQFGRGNAKVQFSKRGTISATSTPTSTLTVTIQLADKDHAVILASKQEDRDHPSNKIPDIRNE